MKISKSYALAEFAVALLVFFVANATAATKAIEGTVFHAGTGAPMAGVFVFAEYRQSGSQPFGHSASWCVKTRRVFTGGDGHFRFPGEPDMTVNLTAILPDYTEQLGRRFTTTTNWFGTTKQIVSPNLYMAPRGTGADERLQVTVCERLQSKDDALANIEYLKLLLVEEKNIHLISH